MFYTLKKQAAEAWFDWQIRGILGTKPMPVIDAPLRIVTLLGKPSPNVLMYILAMKSLYRHLRRGKITVITDTETVAKHGGRLEHHFPGIDFQMLDAIDPGLCQRGGCWERLAYIIRRSADEYIIQMDADTLVTGDHIQEVTGCFERNISFTYADNSWPIKSMADIGAEAKAEISNYIGDVLERTFAEWPEASQVKFVKGSAGFSGFARGQFSTAALEAFHQSMKAALAERWREWGTEQSASNYMIANAPGAVTLPFPDYQTGPLPNQDPRVRFIHFIGSNRYRDNIFADQGKRIIQKLHS